MSFMWGISNVWGEHRDQQWKELAGCGENLYRVGRNEADPGAKTIRAASAREAREIFSRIRRVHPDRVLILEPPKPATAKILRRPYGCGQ